MTAPGRRPPRSDRELVRAVLDGERSAYRELVERHEDSLFRRAVSILGDRDLAADMVQETFIRAYERLADCSDPDRFGGWVYRALRNRCYDDLRAARRRGQPLDGAGPLPAGDDPGDELERGEIRRRIERALETLSPVLREAFVLKHVEGLSYDEMQRETGGSKSALKMRVMRAREELESLLRPLIEETGEQTGDVTPRPRGSSVGWNDERPAGQERP